MIRNRILKNWRLAKGAEKKERIAEALDRFIAEISVPVSTPASTPDLQQLMEWVQFAQESLELGRYKDALRDLSQVLRIARGEEEATPKPYTPPPDGTAAPLVDEVFTRRKEKRISQDDFFTELRAIAQRCGFKIFKRLKGSKISDEWYATLADNIGLEVESGYKDYDLVEWLKKQNLQE